MLTFIRELRVFYKFWDDSMASWTIFCIKLIVFFNFKNVLKSHILATVKRILLTGNIDVEVEAIFWLNLQSRPNFPQVLKSPFWHPLQRFGFVRNVREFLRTHISIARGAPHPTPVNRRARGWKPVNKNENLVLTRTCSLFMKVQIKYVAKRCIIWSWKATNFFSSPLASATRGWVV